MTEETSEKTTSRIKADGVTEYKWDWKKEFKDSFKRMLGELFSMVCILITLVILILSRTEQQLKAVASIINSGDWVVIIMMLIGLLAMSVVVEKILKFFYWLIKTPIVTLWKSVKK